MWCSIYHLKKRSPMKFQLHFDGMVKKGMRVFVPFGRRRLTGYVISLIRSIMKKIFTLKSIEEVCQTTEPVISRRTSCLLLSGLLTIISLLGAKLSRPLFPQGWMIQAFTNSSITDKGIQGTFIKLPNPALPRIFFKLYVLKRDLTPKQLERSLKEKYNPGAL